MALIAIGLVLYAQLSVDGQYFWDLFPAFLISGVGMAFAFIPMTIGALAGVRPSDAGIASGLVNTTQQVGGAIGVAAATTIAATYTSRYLDSHTGLGPASGAALTHGFAIAFYALAAVSALGALLAALLVESKPALRTAEDQGPEAGSDEVVLEEAA
jgi:hypothetical protein